MLTKEEIKEIEKLKRRYSWKDMADPGIWGATSGDALRKQYAKAKATHGGKPVKVTVPTRKPVKQASKVVKSKAKKVVSLSDIHFPIHDERALAPVMSFIRDNKPDVCVLNGDIMDNWLMSTHDKEAAKLFDHGARLQEEFDVARPYIEEIVKHCGEVHYILGNHENRLSRFINKNPAIFELRQMRWERLAELPKEVKMHDAGTTLYIGNLCFMHGDQVGKYGPPKHSCDYMLNRATRNVIFGHTHRVEKRARTVYNAHGQQETYVAINQGHLSDVSKQGYTFQPDWAHGFVYAEAFESGKHRKFNAYPVTIMGGEFIYGGRLYSAKKTQ
jgi:predicted phosphodiesterase